MTNWEAWLIENIDTTRKKKLVICDQYGMDCEGCPLDEVDEDGRVFYDCSDVKDMKRWLEAEVRRSDE